MEWRVTTIETQATAKHIYLEKQLEGASTNFDYLFRGVNEIDECTHKEFKALAKILTSIKCEIVLLMGKQKTDYGILKGILTQLYPEN